MAKTEYCKKRHTQDLFVKTKRLMERGDMIAISDEEAQAIMGGGVKKPAVPPASATSDTVEMDLIVEAIGALDVIEDYTKGGKEDGGVPKCEPLEALSGVINISANTRNEAYEIYLANQSAE